MNITNNIHKRYKILKIFTILLFILILLKLFYVQIIKNNYYKDKLKSLTTKVVLSSSTPRGRIYDRNGNLIVTNKSVKTIYYKKDTNITTKEEVNLAYEVAKLIDVDYSKLTTNMLKDFWIINNSLKSDNLITLDEWNLLSVRKIDKKDIYNFKIDRITDSDLSIFDDLDKEACYIYNLMNSGYSYTEKIIKNDGVSDLEYATIASNSSKLKGFNVKLDWERYYPNGSTFKSILGNVSTIPYNMKDYYLDLGYELTDRVGISYIEYQYEEYLKGEKEKYLVNSDGTITKISDGKRGNDIFLTIDINLQKEVESIVEEELIIAKNEPNTEYFNKAYVIINDPNTGEILAMTSKEIIVNDDGSYTFYDYTPGIITSSVTPGSIVKGASQIVGYNTNSLKIGEVRNDACIKIASTPLKCSFTEYGYLNDINALKYSSNVYQFLTAINVGGGVYKYNYPLVIDESAFDTYRNIFSEFGLGVKTEIDLPNESLGYKGSSRLSGLLLDFSIGQYDTYTPIQIAQYMSTIASGGTRLKPYLLKAVFSDNLSNVVYENSKTVLNKVNTEDIYMNRVKEGLKAVMETGGTGYNYINPIYNPAGKTGTAQSFLDTDSDGVIDTETTTSTFSGFAPYDNPEVVFTVITPDVSLESVNYTNVTKVNKRISQRISEKYFEIYK